MTTKTYHEMKQFDSFTDRLEYLKTNQAVGEETFGYDRYLNQQFYRSKEWEKVRNYVIARDEGNDLGVKGKTIHGTIIVHHINPISKEDIKDSNDILLNPEYLVCVSDDTHRAIHYGYDIKRKEYVERKIGDTKLW